MYLSNPLMPVIITFTTPLLRNYLHSYIFTIPEKAIASCILNCISSRIGFRIPCCFLNIERQWQKYLLHLKGLGNSVMVLWFYVMQFSCIVQTTTLQYWCIVIQRCIILILAPKHWLSRYMKMNFITLWIKLKYMFILSIYV